MKITGITTKEFRWPRHKPIANGKHTYTHVNFAVAEISTDDGITGIGLGSGGAIDDPPSNNSNRCSSARIRSTSSVSGTKCGCRSSSADAA